MATAWDMLQHRHASQGCHTVSTPSCQAHRRYRPCPVLQVNFDLNTITRPIAEGADSLQGLLDDGGWY